MKPKYKSHKRGRNTYKSKKYKCSRKSNKGKYVLYLIIIVFVLGYLYKIFPECININVTLSDAQVETIREVVREELKTQEREDKVSESKEEETKKKEEKKVTSRGSDSIRSTKTVSEVEKLTGYRITSYYPGDNCASTRKTGSGKSTKDFGTMKIGKKTVYTYKGKIVVATATKELLKSGYSTKGSQQKQNKHYFRYYDTFTLTIDGKKYEAIVLDSCGAAMWKGYYRVDIFVPSASDVIDRSNVTISL